MVARMTGIDDSGERVSFGFEDVAPEEKTARVGGVFRSVASRYDLMNDLMSAGIHRVWKHDTLSRLNPQPGEWLLDVAGGTGDLAIGFLKRADKVRQRRGGEPARAVVFDINDAMLVAGKARSGCTLSPIVSTGCAAMAKHCLSRHRSFDALTIGVRHPQCHRRARALAQFRRVLKPGRAAGHTGVFAHDAAGAAGGYDRYSFNVIPRLGRLVTGDSASYQYLVESIRRFPDQEAFAEEIRVAGFSRVSVTNFSGGIAALHFGWAV